MLKVHHYLMEHCSEHWPTRRKLDSHVREVHRCEQRAAAWDCLDINIWLAYVPGIWKMLDGRDALGLLFWRKPSPMRVPNYSAATFGGLIKYPVYKFPLFHAFALFRPFLFIDCHFQYIFLPFNTDNHAILAWLPVYQNQLPQPPQNWSQYPILKLQDSFLTYLFSLGMHCRFKSLKS